MAQRRENEKPTLPYRTLFKDPIDHIVKKKRKPPTTAQTPIW